MLSGYARALGEHPAGLSRARVLRAFRAALAASAGGPLVSFDVANSLAGWAARNQLWPQAAQAYRMAADAWRTLSAAQLDRAYQGTWLARGSDISAAEARAWIRSGQPRQAAVALDAGRGLALSRALDLRGAPGRLVTGNHRDLADRYQRAVGLLRLAATPRESTRPPRRPQPADA